VTHRKGGVLKTQKGEGYAGGNVSIAVHEEEKNELTIEEGNRNEFVERVWSGKEGGIREQQ